MDVRTLMRRAAQHYSSREAIVHNETRLTFAQAWERGVRLANGLLSMGCLMRRLFPTRSQLQCCPYPIFLL